ncbi:MAG TPA: hypothetical protein DCP28_21075 [Cytophagales bacterium]|nr:hypothetical protein [Cytophagales bacterium]
MDLADASYPNWVTEPGATPTDRVFGFTNLLDNLSEWADVEAVWEAAGFAGEAVNVDETSDYQNSRRLVTTVEPPSRLGSASETHGSPAVDLVTPLDEDGLPIFLPVWRYMLFPD